MSWLLLAGVQLLLIVTIICRYAEGDTTEESPVVTIDSLGQVRGSRMQTALAGRPFLAFRGIPYAQPPVGKLRFADPVPVKPWTGQILDGTKEGPACLQYDGFTQAVRGVEDCLKLNVYTHETEPDFLKPVMVWIHGGGFNFGSGNGETDLYGPGYLLDRDVVLVTINYRLGSLGFLTTEDSVAPGNYGLLDQSLSLKWVRDHIRSFGGDNSSVTIFGQSAGGASVDYHILSPRSKGLFDRALAQSGTATCPWARNDYAVGHYSRLLINQVGCGNLPSSRLVIECLRGKDAKEFAEFSQRNTNEVLKVIPFMFSPRIDKEREEPFLPGNPIQLAEQQKFNHVPLMTGVTQNEGSIISAMLLADNGKGHAEFQTDPLYYIALLSGMELWSNRTKIAKSIHDQFLDSSKPYDEQFTAIEQLSSDVMEFYDIDKTAHLYGRYSEESTYYYHYEHKGQFSFANFLDLRQDFDMGVSHGDEIFLIFSNMLPTISSEGDIKMSRILLDLWTSFAKDGKPSSDSVAEWQPLRHDGQTRFLRLGSESESSEEGSMPFHYRSAYWDELYDLFNLSYRTESSNSVKDEL